MKTATEEWVKQLNALVVAPKIKIRGTYVHEIIGASTTINMTCPYVNHPGRKLSDAFRYNEAYWILSGRNDIEFISKHAPSMVRYSDNGHVLQGAYGPKVTEQLRYVTDSIIGDGNTRQAVINIWRENPRASNDIPCTLSLQFLLREGKLNCIATMRSSDIWLGWPYDIFTFSCISAWIASYLGGTPLGTLKLQMGSSHLYEKDYVKAIEALEKPIEDKHKTLPVFTHAKAFIHWLKEKADG